MRLDLCHRVFIFLSILNMFAQAHGQSHTPVIRANSRIYKIKDGDDILEGKLDPSVRQDIYVFHPTGTPKKVTFTTDIDQLELNVEPSGSYDFVVLLNGTQRFPQRICSRNPSENVVTGTPREVPFKLGTDNAIHVVGRINNSVPLDLIFDTGASLGVITDRGKLKGVTAIDGSGNNISFGGISIDKTQLTYIDYHGKLQADGVIGYNSFLGKVVAIDYDRRLMAVRESVSGQGGFHRTPLIWKGAGAFVSTTASKGRVVCPIVALLDTGSRWSLSVSSNESQSAILQRAVPSIGERTGVTSNGTRVQNTTGMLDSLEIAGVSLPNVQVDLEQPSANGLRFSILGNDFLKRFNIIIDYQRSEVYLAPNQLKDVPYNPPTNVALFVKVGACAVTVILLGGVLWARAKKRRLAVSSAGHL